VVKRPMQRRG
jgi:hypothetical protein